MHLGQEAGKLRVVELVLQLQGLLSLPWAVTSCTSTQDKLGWECFSEVSSPLTHGALLPGPAGLQPKTELADLKAWGFRVAAPGDG